tara:strand:- start:9 stop:551 length:543 start_codon:yes stop_codon:yes gene_type:complete
MTDDIKLPNKKYNIIYADPAWHYDKRNEGKRNVQKKYNTMSFKDIYNLPINKIAKNDCILFLWVTYPKLLECIETISKWGFTYKTIAFCWVKKNKKSDTWFWGMGNWTRANSEICLLATKGNVKRISASVHQIIDTPIQKHSKKPDIVRDKIVELVGDLPRIELFARETAEGWDSWGNEV